MPQPSPLSSRHVLITRAKDGASELSSQLLATGAIVTSIPTIEIIPPDSFLSLDQALARLHEFEWIIFTSAHAVEVFDERRSQSLIPGNIAVIGPATARAVEKIGLKVALQPQRYIAESLAEALMPLVAHKELLLVRAAEARDILPLALQEAGAELTIAEAYRNRAPEESLPLIREMFSSPERYPDVITFTSASTVRNLVALLQAAEVVLPASVVLASIGPITSSALRELGLNPVIEAKEASIIALVQAVVEYFAKSTAVMSKNRKPRLV